MYKRSMAARDSRARVREREFMFQIYENPKGQVLSTTRILFSINKFDGSYVYALFGPFVEPYNSL